MSRRENFLILIFLLTFLSQSQILRLPNSPITFSQFGSIPLTNLNFRVLPSSTPQTQGTGFSNSNQAPSSNLVTLSASSILFPNVPAGSFYQIFGTKKHSPSIINLSNFSRNLNGTNNNIVYPKWGSAHIPLVRMSGYNYEDGLSLPNNKNKNPRDISNKLGKIKIPFQTSKDNITAAFVFWGQFIDHDISLTQVSNQYMPIQIPECDEIMDRECKGQYQIPFNRSHSVESEYDKKREQVNFITAWIDGSQVYGSDSQTLKRLRLFENGQMKVDVNRMLPREEGSRFNLFDAGDVRANENVILTSYHTIFVRQHNRLAKRISQMSPFMNDQEIFQAAKNYVIGLIQKITFQDFLPIMIGPQKYQQYIGQYDDTYDPTVSPNITNEFSTAAFRIGHVLMVNKFPLINRYGETEDEKQLHELFFNPSLLNDVSIQKILRGVSRTFMKQKSPQIINQLRNLLIPGAQDRATNLDLFALNIQRGLDHGLPNYNTVREAYGLRSIKTFEQMVQDQEKVRILKEIYGTPDYCDLWVCIICEESLEGAVLGQLGATIVGEQFSRIRAADAFWYQRDYPLSIIVEIRTTYLSDIIMRNTPISDLQQNIFHYKRY